MAISAHVENVVRVASTDLDGDRNLVIGLSKIKGVGYNLSKCIIHAMNMKETTLVKDLSEEKIREIEKIIEDPTAAGIPTWAINRQKDYITGKNIHLTGADLAIAVRDDINRLKKIRSYRGIRHETGQPTRGQRTRSSFRSGATLGVQRKKAVAPAAAPAAGAKKEAGKK